MSNPLFALISVMVVIAIQGCDQRSSAEAHRRTLGMEPVHILSVDGPATCASVPAGFNSWAEYHAWVETTGRVSLSPVAGH